MTPLKGRTEEEEEDDKCDSSFCFKVSIHVFMFQYILKIKPNMKLENQI